MNGEQIWQRTGGLRGAKAAAVLALAAAVLPVRAAQTDISSTPVPVAAAAAVKPNIMLLMDTSDSMKWSHMPDPVESVTGLTSVGYKSSQCNSLYYDPKKTYLQPKKADGSQFTAWPFTGARYDGFGETYAVPNTTVVDLATSFRAYDNATVQIPGFPDPAQAAYYYKHSSGVDSLPHASDACKDVDTGANRAATGPGNYTWQRVTVSTTSGVAPHVNELQNFANWYSYYRTRILLTKSAASLAFTPLTDSFRVGFVTVQPKNAPNDASINPDKFLGVNDFNNAQRTAWFQKVFSQSPLGASPAREGLARVGRYYAGRQDGINDGMPATGINDPLQYSCQQNFTIMTTDGYWNTQTESPGGGPVRIDGTTQIIQADGDYNPTTDTERHCPLSNAYCPRPIHDGAIGTEKRKEEAWHLYDMTDCGLPGQFRSTFRTEKRVTQWTKSFTHVPKRTQYWTTTREQDTETRRTVTRRSTKTKMTTEQYVLTTHQDVRMRYQVYESQLQSTRTTQQQVSTSSQVSARTYETQKTEARQREVSVQHVQLRRQWLETRAQSVQEQRQFTIERRQTEQRQFYFVARPRGSSEAFVNVTACPPVATHECLTRTAGVSTPDWTPVDPATCTAPSTQSGSSPFVVTECRTGAATTALASTPSCAPGDTQSGAPNWIRTICLDNQLQAPTAVAYGSCMQGMNASNVHTFCTTPAGPDNTTVAGGASCTADPLATLPYVANAGTSGAFVRIACSYNLNETTYPASCSGGNEAGNIYRGCSNPPATNYDTYVMPSTCSPGPRGNGQVVTCYPNEVQFATAAVDASTCTSSGWIAGPWYRTCAQVAVGPYPAATFVQTCTPNAGTSPPYTVQECVYPASTNYTNQPVNPSGPACAPSTAGAGNDWREVSCTYPVGPNNQTVAVPPSSCIADPNPSSPYVRVSCSNSVVTIPEAGPVDPSACPIGDTVGPGPDFFVKRCRSVSLGSVVGVCVSGNSGPPNWIQTDCGGNDYSEPVQFCSPLNVPVDDGNGTITTCTKPAGPNNAANVPVLSCTPQDPAVAPTWLRVTCDFQETFPSAVVNPPTCYAIEGAQGPELEFTTCTPTVLSTQFVDECSNVPATSPNWIETQCSNVAGPNNDPTPRRGPACTPGTTYDANHVKIVCAESDSTVFVAGTPPCANQTGDGTNNWTTISCGAAVTSRANVVSGACTAGASVDFPDETTACAETVLQPFAPAPFCTSGVYGNESWTCNPVALTTNQPVASCSNADDPNPPYTSTRCTSGTGPGKQLRKTLTRTTTVSKMSGSVVIGTPVINTVVGSPQDVGSCDVPANVALPSTNPSVAPPNDPTVPAGCTTWNNCEFVRDPGFPGSHNSLADVAQYYYKTDLRSSMDDKVRPKGTGDEDDKAPHQHMTTFVVGLGVSGTLGYRNNYRDFPSPSADFQNIRCPSGIGCITWPIWPDPLVDYSDIDNYANPKSIDDFWHTAVNGRGLYFSANDPASVVSGLGNALTSIAAQSGSGAADGASSFAPTAGNNFAYATSYKTVEWTGDVKAFTISLTDGSLSTTPTWSANGQLASRVKAACDNRNIYLIRMGGELTSGGGQNLVNFAWNSYTCDVNGDPATMLGQGLDTAERQAFDNGSQPVVNFSQYPGMTDGSSGTVDQRTLSKGANLVNFLRGQRQHEDYAPDTQRFYRKREAVLGDFIGSQPVYVGVPFAQYQDAGYGAFLSANATRAATVYVGGNDGMLHAFDAVTGAERWAVIPQSVLGNLYKLADANYKNQHQYFVDGTPVVGDVYDSVAARWRTILVGGLNAGGTGFYAIDVTDPAAPQARWEFRGFSGADCPAIVNSTSDCNVGLSFGKPIITKLNGTWVVLLTSGYNNTAFGDGGGYLYVVNAVTGKLISRIATGAGNNGTPSGLAQINNFVDDTFVDNTTLRAYGGDLLGNIWRFQFGATPTAVKIGEAKDGSNNRQPITTRPELAELDNRPMVFVGTGKLLGGSDVYDSSVQSIYGIVDPLTPTSPVYTDLRTSLKPLVLTQNGTGPTATRNVRCLANCNRTAGWFIDLQDPNVTPNTGERVNIDMKLLFGTLVAATNVPTPDACSTGGSSWLTYLDFRTGLPIAGAPLTDVNDPSSGNASTFMGDSLIAGFNIYQLIGSNNSPFYSPWVRFTGGGAGPGPALFPAPPTTGKRISWREIAN